MRQYLLVLMLLFSLVGCAIQSTEAPLTSPVGNTSNEPTEEPFYAWDFTLTSLEGEEYTLSEMKGQWVLINFWATYCGPCVDEMPALQAIADQYPEELTVLAINQRESADLVRAFKNTLDLQFPLLLNPDDTTLLNYQVIGLPQTIVVDPNGEIVWRQFGPVELATFGAQMDEFIAN